MKEFKCDTCICKKCESLGDCDSCNYCIDKACDWCDDFKEKDK